MFYRHLRSFLFWLITGICGLASLQGRDNMHEVWERYRFALINDDPGSHSFAAIEAGARAAAERLAPPRRLEISMRFLHPHTEAVQGRIDWMRQLFIENTQGLAVKAGDMDADLRAEIDFLAERNIPVVILGDDDGAGKRLAAVVTDEAEAGRMLLRSVGEKLGQRGGSVAVLAGDLGQHSRQERLRGIREALSEYPQLSLHGVYACPETIDGSHNVLNEVVTADRNRRIHAWIFLGGWPLKGVAELPWAPGSMVCVSMDAWPKMLPYLEMNAVQVLLAEDFHAWGEQAVEWLVAKVHEGVEPEPTLVSFPPILINARNLRDYRAQWAEWIRVRN